MKEICCAPMEHAIRDGYVHWPITYDEQKKMTRLTPTISSHERNQPAFLLNYCPWCQKQVNPNLT